MREYAVKTNPIYCIMMMALVFLLCTTTLFISPIAEFSELSIWYLIYLVCYLYDADPENL